MAGDTEGRAPSFQAAMAGSRDPAKQALIERTERSSDAEWDTWSVVIEHGPRARFTDILDFFVNVPSLQEDLSRREATREWRWERFGPVSLVSKFSYPRESRVVGLLRSHAGPDSTIEEGWLIKATHEPHPTEVIKTTSTTSYLLATRSYYAYVETYAEIDH